MQLLPAQFGNFTHKVC